MKFLPNMRILAVVAAALLPACAARAAQHYDAIYVFGDSYCDVGNIYIATRGAIPLSPPYYKGRFSNGPIWVEHLANTFKIPLLPALAGGTDYAFGGAEMLQDLVTPAGTVPSVPSQVALYLSTHGGKADPDALYILEGGGNDILNATSGSPADLGVRIALTLAGIELGLRQAGARHFVIPNLFDVGLLPAGRANYAFDTVAVQATNKSLHELLKAEDYLEGIYIYAPDIYTLGHDIEEDKTHYGFSDVATPCLNPTTGAVCADPAHTLMWDQEHPTEFAHSFIAVAVGALVHP